MAAEQRWTIEQHRTAGGRVPVLDFLGSLTDERHQNDGAALVRLLAERGNLLRPPHSQALGSGLYELRGHQVRRAP